MRWITLSGLVLVLGAACVHAPPPAPAARAAKGDMVLITGSHLRQRADVATSGLPSMSPMRVYSREDIWGTGRQGDLHAALRSLDTSLP